VLDSVLPLERGRDAYQRMDTGEQFGKIVLDVAGASSPPGQKGS
jgi:hypothetical protein